MAAGHFVSAAERVSDAAGHATREAPHHPPDSRQTALVLFHQADIILQLRHRHFDVTGVPEDPPNEAEEDDNGPCVDEQVVEKYGDKDPDKKDRQAHCIKGHRGPETAGTATQAPELPLHVRSGVRKANLRSLSITAPPRVPHLAASSFK